MSRSIRKETSSLAFGIVGRFGGSSAGFVVAALNAASAASREVVVLRVLSAGIYVLALGLHSVKRKLTAIRKRAIGDGRNVAFGAVIAAGQRRVRWPFGYSPCSARSLRMRPSYMPIVFLCQSISR